MTNGEENGLIDRIAKRMDERDQRKQTRRFSESTMTTTWRWIVGGILSVLTVIILSLGTYGLKALAEDGKEIKGLKTIQEAQQKTLDNIDKNLDILVKFANNMDKKQAVEAGKLETHINSSKERHAELKDRVKDLERKGD